MTKAAECAFQKLREAVREYLNEVDNPIPDHSYCKLLRERLRKLVETEES